LPMKTIFITLLSVFGALFPPVEQVPVALDDVCRAVGSGDVSQLVAVMDAEVELSILDEEDLYSREQAKTALTNFFAKNKPTNFGKVHQGASKSDDAEYCIGTLATAQGTFRVYIYVAKRSDGILLQELRFDRN
ncbi:MAG: DUF4783 domain-containing protein, partial [Bacteroidota bacterium]